MTRRSVKIGAKECSLVICEGAVAQLGALLEELPATSRVVAVTDDNVSRCQGARLPRDIETIVIPAGEQSKNLANFELLTHALLDKGMDRHGVIVAFGGGVVGDLAGFVAATFMRGVRWVNVPTTVLSMVDASIGGKTAIDIEGAKNLVGAFHSPEMVVADALTLETLPDCEKASGMAEVIKHALIRGGPLFERLQSGHFGTLEDIEQAIDVKASIVERDPFERGERAILNLGHTVGHGIESASGYQLSHGQAVAIGLVAEAKIAESIGLAQAGLAECIVAVARRFSLPATCHLRAEGVRDAMAADKKRAHGRLRFALPTRVGEVVYGVEVEEGAVMEALESVCRRL